MLVSYDPDAGATYVELSKAPVHHTIEVNDVVMADVDATGAPVGLEFLVLPDKITTSMLQALRAHFPDLALLREPERWLPLAG